MESENESVSEDIQGSIREELSSMTLEEILKMKDELGAKAYNEVVLGSKTVKKKLVKNKSKEDLKRLNKNRPREMFANRQVPFLGVSKRKKAIEDSTVRDPRFDANAGEFKIENFKEDYKFISDIREREIGELRKQMKKEKSQDAGKVIKLQMQRLINKNLEDHKWHKKQHKLREEKQEIQRTLQSNQKPHFLTKKERRVKELVEQFEDLKKAGRLTKHLEKRRKKNAGKDRKKIALD